MDEVLYSRSDTEYSNKLPTDRQSESDIDPYYSDDSVITAEICSSGDSKDQNAIEIEIGERSEICLEAVTNSLEEAVKSLSEDDVRGAMSHCLKTFEILKDIDGKQKDSDMLMGYRSCSRIFQQCEDHKLALESHYRAFLIQPAEPLEPYPIHASEVMIYWIPVIEVLTFIKLILLIRQIKAEADTFLAANEIQNRKKALYIYLDLNLSLQSLNGRLPDIKVIFEDLRSIHIKIAKCFLLMGLFEDVCKICKRVDTHFPIATRNTMASDFLQMWGTGLLNIGKFDVARKKVEQALEVALTKTDKDSAKCLLSRINKMEEDSRVSDNVSIDSDDEYVKDSNYTIVKQQRQKAEEVKDNHNKKTRRRPKRLSETQDFFVESAWEDVAKNRKARKRHRTASSTYSQMSTELEQLPLPEGHDNSDIESDYEFDMMSKIGERFGEDASSSDENVDFEDFLNVDQYERSVNKFDDESDDDFDEHDLLQNGIDLSDIFLEQYRKPSHDKSHFTYPEFDIKEKCEELCRRNPLKYKRCIVKIESSHRAVCTNLDPTDDISEIEISGRSKIGKVFNEDEVYVEVLKDEREAYKGKNFIPRLQKTLDLTKMSLKVYG